MRLIKDTSPGARAVYVSCIREECRKSIRLSDAVADIDGPAFLAYYCPSCAAGIGADVLGSRRECIAPGCHGLVPWDQGSDYCAACIRADQQ